MIRKMVAVLPLPEESLREQLKNAAEARGFLLKHFVSDEDALPELEDAEILLGQSAFLAKNAPRVRWICTPSAGIDQFAAPGVIVSPDAALSNSSGAYGVTIAEHVVMAALEMLRRQQDYEEIVRRREWVRNLPVRSLRDARITLLGTGDIGRETAVRLRAFAPASLTGVNRGGKNPDGLFDRVLTRDRLREVLPETDILIASLPGTPETKGMLNRESLTLLPDGALLVNVGRGSLVDQRALEAELRAGRLRAALDVFEEEPLPPDASLWSCPNLLITPHTAGNMTLPYTRRRIVELFLEDFENYCAGRPLLRRVDPRRGY